MPLNAPYDHNNPFAKIIRKEIPAITVYEDALTLAFMDIMPQVPGHVLVIPKAPATNLLKLSAEDAQALIVTTQKISRAVQQALDAPGLMICQLNGPQAGQTVFHMHVHVLPRYDGVDMAMHARDVGNMEEIEAIAAKIRAALE